MTIKAVDESPKDDGVPKEFQNGAVLLWKGKDARTGNAFRVVGNACSFGSLHGESARQVGLAAEIADVANAMGEPVWKRVESDLEEQRLISLALFARSAGIESASSK